jgi:toxin ParE1/3/4
LRRVFYSLEARIDLLGIGSNIEQFNPPRSETFVTELRTKANNIAHFPNAYPARDDLQAGLRIAIHGHYNILFRVTDLEVEIVRVIHGARDLHAIFRK